MSELLKDQEILSFSVSRSEDPNYSLLALQARAVTAGIVSAAQAEALWTALAVEQPMRRGFTLPNIAYSLGALIVIGAMGWFMTEAWERFGGGGISLIA